MNRVQKLESLTESWLRPLPHLPSSFRKWLADNAWWLAVITAFVSAVAALAALNGIFSYISYVGNADSYAGFYVTAPNPTSWLLSSLLGLIYFAAVTVLLARAATPLKEHQRRGWDMVFIVLVLGAAKLVLDALFSFSFFGFIFAIIFGWIWVAIAAYLLFEVRSYFVKSGHAKPAKK